MQLAPQETIDALAGAVWLPVLAVEPEGSAICQCIRTTHPSGLYITRDGIITHNSTPPGPVLSQGQEEATQFADVERANADVLRAHDEKGKPLPAPNGKPSKLTRHQWVIARASHFKRLFGDWETAAKIKAVRELLPVDSSDTAPVADKAEAKKAFQSFGDKITNRTDERKVRFPAETVGKILRHNGFDAKTIIKVMDRVFEQAVPAWSEPENVRGGHKQHRNIARYHHYIGKVRHDGENWFVRFTVTEMVSRKKGEEVNLVHSSFISNVALYEEGAGSSLPVIDRAKGPPAPYDNKLDQWLASVNPDSVNGEIDPETGEPLASYVDDSAKASRITLASQAYPISPKRMAKIDEYEARAASEVDGNRSVGDPRLAFSTESAQWMAFDELRKAEFERERERDWQAVAERMLRDDPAGVREALLDAAVEGKILMPIQTKAAQLLIAAESALPRTPERRAAIYQLIEAYRATGAEAGRALSARQDPFATPLQRWKAFFAEQIYTPPARIRRLMDGGGRVGSVL